MIVVEMPDSERIEAIVISDAADLVGPEFEELREAGPHGIAGFQAAHLNFHRGRPDRFDDDRVAGREGVDYLVG
jgi:hypothetical protein